MSRIICYADFHFLKKPILLGFLNFTQQRGKEYTNFEFSKEWISSKFPFTISPDIQNALGVQYPSGKLLFSSFSDSCPNRWGRTLIKRRALQKGIKNTFEEDFLLGVDDPTRMGGIRFKLSEEGNFLANEELAVPPFEDLRKLEAYSKDYEDKGIESKWFQNLVAPGSSLGGARPKATIKDEKGHLWMAKFPSRKDQLNIGAWEYVVQQVAENAGIAVPETKIFRTSEFHTFLSKRFDRTNQDKRIHYCSAMTLTGHQDGDDASFLDIALAIEANSINAKEDLKEFYRRIVFSALINNTDNHLRNHGFLLMEKGWRLSPAFDMNISLDNTFSALSFDGNEHDFRNIDAIKESAEYYRVTNSEYEKILSSCSNAVSKIPLFAKAAGIAENEIKEVCRFLNL